MNISIIFDIFSIWGVHRLTIKPNYGKLALCGSNPETTTTQTIGGNIEQKLMIDLRGLKESKSIIRPPPKTILVAGPPQRPIAVDLWYPLTEFSTRFTYEIKELKTIKYLELRPEHWPKIGGLFKIETFNFYFFNKG